MWAWLPLLGLIAWLVGIVWSYRRKLNRSDVVPTQHGPTGEIGAVEFFWRPGSPSANTPLGWSFGGDAGYNHAVTWFSARNASLSTVPAASADIWQLITDPGTLAALTPLVRSIEPSGAHWLWALNGIEGLGMKVEATFTERMDFTEGSRILFAHDPPHGRRERAGVAGIYDLVPLGDEATELQIDLRLSVDLPLPRLSRPAVERVMATSMRATGQRFAANLYERLGLDPSTVAIIEVA